MWSFNPSVYLQHAWDKTNSKWGKLSLVLFYTYVWLGILKTFWGTINPNIMGMLTCYLSDDVSSWDESVTMVMARGCFLSALFFLIYADKGGLHSWNVGFVTVYTLVWMWIAKSTFLDPMPDATYDACIGNWGVWMWISPGWIVLAFITVLMDERMGDAGSAGERQALNI